MAAARALSIPEIILEVAQHVRAEPVSEQRSVLARLARVNRVFHGHVVRVLWADLPNLDPLFRLLPNCVCLPDPAPVDNLAAGGDIDALLAHAAPQPLHSMRLDGPTLDEDIARLREHAGLVRALDFRRSENQADQPSRGIRLEPPSLEALLARTGLPLLPALTKLTLPVTPPYDSDPTFLICPALRDLTLSFADWHVGDLTNNIGALFDGVFAQNSRLTRLRVQSESYTHHDPEHADFTPWSPRNDWLLDDADTASGEASSRAFCDALAAVAVLQDLEVFSMATMNTGVAGRALMTALSALPQLRDSSFGVDIPQNMLPTVPPGFPSLRALTLSNVLSGRELQLFDSPHLRALTLHHPARVADGAYHGIAETVRQRFPGLRRLAWMCGRRRSTIFGAAPGFLPTAIQPLSALDGLRELSVDVKDRRVADEDIALLADGFPRLSHLALAFDVESQKDAGTKTAAGPTARSLLTLARGCPALRSLRLGGVVVTAKDEAEAATYPFVGNRLRSLDIVDLRCEGEVHAAMIVDVLFPYLDIRECRRRADAGRGRKGQWCEVLDRLEGYHAARE